MFVIVRPCQEEGRGGGGVPGRLSLVACRNFKMSRVGVLSGLHVAVTYICPCRNFN